MVELEKEELVEQCLSELEKNAIGRRQRLLEMRAKFAGNNKQKEGDDGEEGEGDGQQPVLLLFRSYKPVGREGEAPHLGSTKEEIKTIEKKVADQLEASKDTKVGESLDLNTLAPRKVDWDLRRGIQEKLDKLERRTSKSITQLIRKRMDEEGKGEDSELLAAAVASIGEK